MRRWAIHKVLPLSLLLAAPIVAAWEAPPTVEPLVGIMADPCAAISPLPKAVRSRTPPAPASAQMAERQRHQQSRKVSLQGENFAGHCRYQSENTALPAADSTRVVLFGDSITALWKKNMPGIFNGQFLDRGISGQTTAQMLVRFRPDVIDLAPAVVVHGGHQRPGGE